MGFVSVGIHSPAAAHLGIHSATSSVMHNAGTTLVIALSIVLLFAIGLVVVCLGKFVYGIAHYYLRERKPERQFYHAELGNFISEGDLWSCELRRDGRDMRLLIRGTEEAPSEPLLLKAESILSRLVAVHQRALEFLRSREEEVRDARLDLYSLDITDEQHPDDFTVEFIDPGEDSRIWRVEFIDGEPKETGFDD